MGRTCSLIGLVFRSCIYQLEMKSSHAQWCTKITNLQNNRYKVLHNSRWDVCSSPTVHLVAHGGSSHCIDLSLVLEPNYKLQTVDTGSACGCQHSFDVKFAYLKISVRARQQQANLFLLKWLNGICTVGLAAENTYEEGDKITDCCSKDPVRMRPFQPFFKIFL